MFRFTCSATKQKSLPAHLKLCQQVLDFLKSRPDSRYFFNQLSRQDIQPDYHQTIKHPMDFTMISRKILDASYPDLASFKSDVDLVWQNCLAYHDAGSDTARRCIQLQMEFDEQWELHSKIRDPAAAHRLIRTADQIKFLVEDELSDRAIGMALFRTPQDRPHTRPDTGLRPSRVEKRDRHRPERVSFALPSEEELNRPMTIEERYDLAVAIDTLPEQLLHGVVDILVTAKKIKSHESMTISFRDLENSTLRRLEACVKEAKTKEADVRQMLARAAPMVTPDEKQRYLDDLASKIRARLKEKHAGEPSEDVTSETYTTDEGSGSTAGSDDEGSSG
jgi:hypothetical protein